MAESRPKGRVYRGARLLPIDGAPITNGDLWIAEGRILAVSSNEPAAEAPATGGPPPRPAGSPPSPDGFEVVDATAHWIVPGFVATHVHLCQTLFRGQAEGLDLYRWLSRVIWPLEAAHDPQTIAVAAEAGLRQLLSSGVTTLLDMGTAHHTEAILETAARMGVRGFFGPAWMDRGPKASAPLFRTARELADDVERLAARFHGQDDGRLRITLCPRFVPSVSDASWRTLAAEPSWRGFPIHTHGSETREEVDEVRRLTGTTPPRYCAGLAGGEGRVKMAHAIWIDDDDRAALAGSGAAVLHCPGSNFKLGSGRCDVAALERAGIPVGYGPDGAACNHRLDPWHEMRLAAYVRSALHGPAAVDPAAILRQATWGGAEALGLGDEIGTLTPGKRADFVVLDPRLEPTFLDAGADHESPESALVFAGSPALVAETVVGGRTVYRRDDPGAAEERRRFAARLRAALVVLKTRARLYPPEESTP